MEKNIKEKENSWGMGCTMCHAHDPRFYMFRWLLGIIILFLMFWLGFNVGEYKGYFDSFRFSNQMNYGGGRMMRSRYTPQYPVTPQPMIPVPVPGAGSSTVKPNTTTK